MPLLAVPKDLARDSGRVGIPARRRRCGLYFPLQSVWRPKYGYCADALPAKPVTERSIGTRFGAQQESDGGPNTR